MASPCNMSQRPGVLSTDYQGRKMYLVCFSFASELPRGLQLLLHTSMLYNLNTNSEAMGAKQLLTVASKTVSQNKPYLFLCRLS